MSGASSGSSATVKSRKEEDLGEGSAEGEAQNPEGEDTMKNLRKTFAGIFGEMNWYPEVELRLDEEENLWRENEACRVWVLLDLLLVEGSKMGLKAQLQPLTLGKEARLND